MKLSRLPKGSMTSMTFAFQGATSTPGFVGVGPGVQLTMQGLDVVGVDEDLRPGGAVAIVLGEVEHDRTA